MKRLPPVLRAHTSYWISKVLYAAAKLGLADQLAAGPRTADELAGPTRTHAPSSHWLMRTLASLGVLTERDAQRFALTPLGEALRAGAPRSARATLLTLGSPWFVGAFENIMHSLETGGTGFEKAMGMPIFDYLGQHPEDARRCSARRWSASTAPSRRLSPLLTIFPSSEPWWMWAALAATC
jgi:hypothetical protein